MFIYERNLYYKAAKYNFGRPSLSQVLFLIRRTDPPESDAT